MNDVTVTDRFNRSAMSTLYLASYPVTLSGPADGLGVECLLATLVAGGAVLRVFLVNDPVGNVVHHLVGDLVRAGDVLVGVYEPFLGMRVLKGQNK